MTLCCLALAAGSFLTSAVHAAGATWPLGAPLARHAATQNPSLQPPPSTQAEDQETKEKRRQAGLDEAAGKYGDALKLYQAVFEANPNDPVARDDFLRISGKVQQEQKDTAQKQQESDARAQQGTELESLLRDARSHLAKARAGMPGAEAELSAADETLGKARKLTKEDNADINALSAAVAQQRTLQSQLWWEYWGGIGVMAGAVVVGLVVYFWKRGGAIEMINGPAPGQVFGLRADLTRIGASSAEMDWAIADPQRRVSRYHCDIIRNRRHYFVVDRSTNGTFVNQRKISKGEAVLLRRGDQITLGGDVILRFR